MQYCCWGSCWWHHNAYFDRTTVLSHMAINLSGVACKCISLSMATHYSLRYVVSMKVDDTFGDQDKSCNLMVYKNGRLIVAMFLYFFFYIYLICFFLILFSIIQHVLFWFNMKNWNNSLCVYCIIRLKQHDMWIRSHVSIATGCDSKTLIPSAAWHQHVHDQM